MPFIVFKTTHKPYGEHYMLKKIKDGTIVKKHFKTREGAIGFAKNAIMFREKKKAKVVGNKILPV